MKLPQSRIGAIALFLGATVALEACWMTTGGVYPAKTLFQATVMLLVGAIFVGANIWLNRAFLQNDGLPKSALGLGVRQLPWFFAGCAIAVPVIFAMAGALRLMVPFHWVPGTLRWHELPGQFARYLVGNGVEELIFRGYLLVMLRRWLGLPRALAITGVLFGLFHLPGMSGIAALKMVCTTAAMSVVFAMAYVRTKSLWTAIGVHVSSNMLLHRVLGMSGEQQSLFRMQIDGRWPAAYDPGLIAYFSVVAVAAFCLGLWRGAGPAKGADQISG